MSEWERTDVFKQKHPWRLCGTSLPTQELEPDLIFESITPELLSHQSLARFWEAIHFKQYFFFLIVFFFLYGSFLKSLLNLSQYCFCIMFCFFWPQGMWDLNSLTRNGTCIGRWSLNHWTARKSLEQYFLMTFPYIWGFFPPLSTILLPLPWCPAQALKEKCRRDGHLMHWINTATHQILELREIRSFAQSHRARQSQS